MAVTLNHFKYINLCLSSCMDAHHYVIYTTHCLRVRFWIYAFSLPIVNVSLVCCSFHQPLKTILPPQQCQSSFPHVSTSPLDSHCHHLQGQVTSCLLNILHESWVQQHTSSEMVYTFIFAVGSTEFFFSNLWSFFFALELYPLLLNNNKKKLQ